ncbi:hypothetical protein B0H67DRAFT_583403 [Lasiosphaeris hirsuta]|uniref:Uncharacterized protein n=1 Tax=Lasiosphaeris hirsuta TaxID=260670 RepID=A0AA40A7U2_9PEZI|nr:hypothetical protein B0H67DRAFT_583403 [Lasiosphaeris hirsuta]
MRSVTPKERHAELSCRHCQWDEEYPLLVPNMADFSIDRISQDTKPISSFSLPIVAMEKEARPLLEEASKMHERLRCTLFHKIKCLCPASTHWGVVRSCPHCHTDFAVSIAPSPTQPGGRWFVFIAWKYLGNGPRNCYWESHANMTGSPLRYDELGSMYYGYEVASRTPKVSSDDYGRCQHLHTELFSGIKHSINSGGGGGTSNTADVPSYKSSHQFNCLMAKNTTIQP